MFWGYTEKSDYSGRGGSRKTNIERGLSKKPPLGQFADLKEDLARKRGVVFFRGGGG